MKKEYIRIEEMKDLFSLMPLLKSMKLSLDVELKRVSGYTKDDDLDYIESMTFGNAELSDMPFANTNETSDKTANTALSYQKQISNEEKEAKKAIKDICNEIYRIDIIIDKIEIGLKGLDAFQKELLILKYWDSKTWNEIVEQVEKNKQFYSKRQIQEMVKKSIIKLNTIALIDMNTYKNVKLLINSTKN